MKVLMFLGVAILAIIPDAWAELSVDRSVVFFEPDGQRRQDVQVANSGAEVMSVLVEVALVNHPGTAAENQAALTDPRDLQLFATPNKLIIPAGIQRPIRIVNLQQQNATERVYLIDITPTLPQSSDATDRDLMILHQVLVIVPPDKPAPDLQVTRSGKRARLTNNGNSSAILIEGKQCDVLEPDNCQPLAEQRLYPGNTLVLALPFDGAFSFDVQDFAGIRQGIYR